MRCNVGVAIVNYKTAPLVVECLAALATCRSDVFTLTVCVVDNASPDNSFLVLSEAVAKQCWSDWVHLIAAPKNGGFAYGNNLAFDYLLEKHCDYYWLLNPDAKPTAGAMEILIDYLVNNPRVGCVGSQLTDVDGTRQLSAFNFPRPFGEFVAAGSIGMLVRMFPRHVVANHEMNFSGSVDWVAGASMMLRAEVLAKVGNMDEHYFLYYEEVDYCHKIHGAGFDIHFVPASQVIHHVGAATGISDHRRQAPRRPGYWFESRRRFFRKNYGPIGALLADVCWIVGYGCYRVKSVIKGQPNLDPPKFFSDFVHHSMLNPFKHSNH